MTRETSFDQRVVRYEKIHSIQPDDFTAFVNAADIHGACRILDCGCGYGAVTREVIRVTQSQREAGEESLAVDLIDESAVQLKRARRELQRWRSAPGITLSFIQGTFPQDLTTASGSYDVVFCKMVLHEVSKDKQLQFLTGMHDSLKPGGKLVFWDLCLSDDIAKFYRDVVRKKDHLAGYDTMEHRRNFLTEGELIDLFTRSPFRSYDLVKDIDYQFDTHVRFFPEFLGNPVNFDKWQRFIRGRAEDLGAKTRERIHYRDRGSTISFHVRKVIGIARRVQECVSRTC